MLIAGVILSGVVYSPAEPDTGPATTSETASSPTITPAGQPTDYAQARADLLAALEQRRADLPADAFATVVDNLGIIDRTIVEIANALEKDPGNPRLTRLLTAAYQRELDLLRRAATLP